MTIEVQGLEERLRSGKLTDADVASLLKILSLVQTLRTLLQKRSLGLLTLLRKLFGVKTEKHEPSERSKVKIFSHAAVVKGATGVTDIRVLTRLMLNIRIYLTDKSALNARKVV